MQKDSGSTSKTTEVQNVRRRRSRNSDLSHNRISGEWKNLFYQFYRSTGLFPDRRPTLLITTEEGEVEYDEKELLKHNTVLEIVEGPEQFTLDYLKKLNRKYRPERIILEYNPFWSVKKLEEMELPRGWGIVQEIVTVDASCFQIYMQNMKSVFMEMAKNADMVMFNRCRPEDPLPSFRRSIKVVNQACDVLFENEEGEIDNIFEDQMPFDTDADVIEIDDADYGIWYVDMGDNPERYEGKTVHFRGMVLKSKDVGADFFVPGRMAMTCCADDTSFIGYVCKCASAKSLVMGSWVDVTATVKWGYMKVYDGEGRFCMQKKSNRPKSRRANWYILTKEKEQSYIRQQRAGKVFSALCCLHCRRKYVYYSRFGKSDAPV